MQQISIERFSYNKQTGVLSEEASSLTGQLSLAPLLYQGEHFEVRGRREIKRYGFSRTIRQRASNEFGDVIAWEFRPINALGRFQPGPMILIEND